MTLQCQVLQVKLAGGISRENIASLACVQPPELCWGKATGDWGGVIRPVR